MDFVEKTSKFEFSSRGYPIHFVQKSFQKLTTKGGVKASVKSSRDITVVKVDLPDTLNKIVK